MKSQSVVLLVNIMMSVESQDFTVQNAPTPCYWYNTMVDCSFLYSSFAYGTNTLVGVTRKPLNSVSHTHSNWYDPSVTPNEKIFLKPQHIIPKINIQNFRFRHILPHTHVYPGRSNTIYSVNKKNTHDASSSQSLRPETDVFTSEIKKKDPIRIQLSNIHINNTVFTNTVQPNQITAALKPNVTNFEGKPSSQSIPLYPNKNPNVTLYEDFMISLDAFERNFYLVTFIKLSSISPEHRRENGISFIQSGLFLYFHLISLLDEVEPDVRKEIEACLGRSYSEKESTHLIRKVFTSLPSSSDDLKFMWSSRLVLAANRSVSQGFLSGAASALKLKIDHFNGTETPDDATQKLNLMIETDSQGAMQNTFDEEELEEGICAALLSVTYIRGRWRSSPTLLKAPKPFYDDENVPQRSVRMIKINDIMKYADIEEWNAQALEVFYSTPGLSLLMFVPRGRSLRSLATNASATSIHDIVGKMKTMRVAATLPLYTLRMTLLLPSKLFDLNITHLVNTTNCKEESGLKLSHAVQRIMFWAEAGRNAFKEDGIEWDPSPEIEVVVDRPYIFFVRWNNITLLNGNFVL